MQIHKVILKFKYTSTYNFADCPYQNSIPPKQKICLWFYFLLLLFFESKTIIELNKTKRIVQILSLQLWPYLYQNAFNCFHIQSPGQLIWLSGPWYLWNVVAFTLFSLFCLICPGFCSDNWLCFHQGWRKIACNCACQLHIRQKRMKAFAWLQYKQCHI